MHGFTKRGTLAVIMAVTTMAACAADPSTDANGDAPDAVLDDAVSPQDEGTTYNGWTQQLFYINQFCYGLGGASHQLNRSWGDTTRGGGACFVQATGASCSSDTSCTASARAQYGGTAYGYCYQGTCYSRPGGQERCAMNPNRAHSHYVNPPVPLDFNTNNAIVGCMTKNAGPNTACGGTDGSLYMRSVYKMVLDPSGCF